MRSAKKLVKGRKYEINYTGPEEYCHFNGIGEYTGKIDDAMVGSLEDNNIYYGFILDNIKGSTQEDPNWFPIESIHELEDDNNMSDNNNSWQPIENAPRDNIIVLTNVGFARFVKNSVAEDPFWYLCDMNGVRKFEGCQIYIVVFPEFWMPVPPIPVDKR